MALAHDLAVTVSLASPEATAGCARAISELLVPGDTILLEGPIGAGKSHFCRAAIRQMLEREGREEDIPSPTFTLVQTYPDLAVPVAHADLYRLESAAEAEPLALDDWLLDGALLLEWPERLGNMIWPERLWLRLDGAGGPDRRLTWDAPPAWEGRWPAV